MWFDKKGNCHEQIKKLVDQLEQDDANRIEAWLTYLSTYSGLDKSGFTTPNVYQSVIPSRTDSSGLWNVAEQIVDTLCSEVGQNKPRPKILTSGGDWDVHRKSKLLTKYIDGLFSHLDVYETGHHCFKIASILGTAAVKVFLDAEGNEQVEGVFPFEVFVDPRDALHRKPGQLYQKKPASKKKLAEQFPKFKIEIAESAHSNFYGFCVEDGGLENFTDVYEAWHLPQGKKKGRHVVAIGNATLIDEEYEHKEFPFVFLRLRTRPIGFWGQGAVEQVCSIQWMINYCLHAIKRGIRYFGKPWVLVEYDSKVHKESITDNYQLIQYSRTPPRVDVHNTVSPDVRQFVDQLYNMAFERVGLNRNTVTARREPGITSGAGQREISNKQSTRLWEMGEAYERFYENIAKRLIDIGKTKSKTTKVRATEKNTFQEITWKDVDMATDKYVLQFHRGSLLSLSPGARIETLTEWMNAGIIDQTQFLALGQFHDLEKFQDLAVSGQNIVMQIVDDILDDGIYRAPTEFIDLEFAVKYARQAHNEADLKGFYPEEHLKLLRQFIAEATLSLQKSQEPPQDGMQGPPPDPNGGPPPLAA